LIIFLFVTKSKDKNTKQWRYTLFRMDVKISLSFWRKAIFENSRADNMELFKAALHCNNIHNTGRVKSKAIAVTGRGGP
jgi:hypothetical protein